MSIVAVLSYLLSDMNGENTWLIIKRCCKNDYSELVIKENRNVSGSFPEVFVLRIIV